MELIKLSFAISIIAFTYSVILTEPGMLLEKIASWAAFILPEWLFMPLIGCEKCVAGQMALWYCAFFEWQLKLSEYIFVVMFSIFIVTFIKPVYSWMQRF